MCHFLPRRRRSYQSPSLPATTPLSKVSARPPLSYAASLSWRHQPCPGPWPNSPPAILANCFRPWRQVRSESKRRLIWRCSGKWLACPRIGNASTATSAARLMSTWQWAPSSVPPALASCEFPLGWKNPFYPPHGVVVRSTADFVVVLARLLALKSRQVTLTLPSVQPEAVGLGWKVSAVCCAYSSEGRCEVSRR